jgi:hypothetical protein
VPDRGPDRCDYADYSNNACKPCPKQNASLALFFLAVLLGQPILNVAAG